ncbi:WSC domain-containing protein [Xylaria flabelliformis]|nr:WSC domain-containing protein [Xylaria flabelliformis]
MVAIKSLAAITALSFVHTAHAWYNDLPSCLTPFDPFVYTGCYDNGQPGQPEALSLRTDLDQQNMTVEICVAHCKGNDYRLAGLSYYGVCYCGQTVSTALLPEDQCSFPCTGNSSETCGGDSEINIWMDPTFPPLGDQKNVTEYVPVGCWTDDSTDGKALFYRQDNLDSSTLTTEKCLQSCLNGGFPFAGTEYGGECYCGVVIGNGTDLATDASTCNMPCNGNSNETCGGPSRLSLYVAKDLQSLEPCGTPPDTSSTITYPVTIITYPVSTTTPSSSSTKTTYPVSSTTSSTKTPPSSSTTTTSAPVCTTTTVTPPSCEYKIGKWCSNPVPDWHDKKSCLLSWSQCALQSTSCFLKAGFPDALHCFEYAEWCTALNAYCFSKCSGSTCDGKSTFTQKYPPKGGNSPTTQTSTYPCPTTIATTTTKTTTTAGYPTSSCPVPTPTGICVQPTNNKYHYGPGNPVGGIPLPIVTCNNIKDDWNAGNVFKLYTDNDSHKCPSYPRPSCPNACADACKTQFQQCESVYTEGCKSGSFAQQYKDADAACKAQYSDCLAINKNVKGTGQCSTWTDGCHQ